MATHCHNDLPGGLPRPIRVWAIAALACCGSCCALSAADKSGVTPNTISLPQGPGAIEGLGESFQPTINTGTAKYAIALKLPPGTAGHQPGLTLVYEGGNANGPLGFGWQLPIPFVQRKSDEGVPTYGEYVGFERSDTYIDDSKEELVPQSSGFYFAKNEGAFMRYQFNGLSWIGATPDGARMEFGLSDSGRIQDGTNRVFAWQLERETDTHSNTILYFYTNFPGLQNTNQKYLVEIRYGPGAPPWTHFHFARLAYEDRADWFEDCRAGFAIRTGKRLKSVVIGTQGPTLTGHQQGDFNQDGVTDNLVRRYELEYLDAAGASFQWSLLASIRWVGADGATALPPATFGYTVCAPPAQISAANHVIGGANEPLLVMDSSYVDFADLNADGLPDVLRTGGPEHFAFLNRGEKMAAGQRLIQWEGPVVVGAEAGGAWNYGLDADNTHLADLDGDGLADLVHKSGPDTVFYFRNRGAVQWAESQLMSTGEYPPPAPFGVPDVRTADVDFDKRMDLLRGDGLQYQVWFNHGQNRYSERITVPHESAFDFAQETVLVADFNGDRLPDVAQVRPAGIEVSAGLGYGRFADRRFVSLPDDPLEDAQVRKAKLIDINGDGLADLVIERASPGELWFWLNRGNYSLSERKTIADMPIGVGLNAAIRWADVNGNGSDDLVYADSAAEPRLHAVDIGELLGCLPSPNTLCAISNGIGRVTLIGYEPSTKFALEDAAAGQPWPDPMPFPVSVVASVTNLDSLGHAYVTRFRYHDGYYDPEEKQFRGFARAEQIDVGDPTAPTLVTRSHFDTGRNFEAMKGKLLALAAEQEDGKRFWTETNFWTVPPVTLYTGANGTNVTYVHPVAKTRLITELGQGTPRRIESEFAYDRFGNQTTNADYGIVEDGDRSAFNDERITVTHYALNTNAWLLRFPARQEIMDEHGIVISRSESFYDDETFSGDHWGIVTVGNLTMKRDWIDPAIPSAYVTSARTQYDPYGNPIVLLDPLAKAPGGSIDHSRGHVRQLEYDSLFHTQPVAETIHVGDGKEPLVFRAGYDPGFGAVIHCIDFNGNATIYSYDAVGRLVNVVKPYDTPEYPTVEYDYVLAQPFGPDVLVNYIETRQRDKSEILNPKSEMYFVSRQFSDGMGRKLMVKEETIPDPETGKRRVVVKEATAFNQRQKPAFVLNPYYTALKGSDLEALVAFEDIATSDWTGLFHSEGVLVLTNLTHAHKTAMEYDAILRQVKTINPDNTCRWNVFKPLRVESFDENDSDPTSAGYDTPTVHYQDGLDRLIQVDENARLGDDGHPVAELRTWTTRYEYDLQDQLTNITDSQNNVKTFAYDGLQRKTDMNDPNRGVMHFVYDDASNLIETTDAKGQRITYTYDGVNRIRTEKYHDGQPTPPWRELSTAESSLFTNSVIYHYDTPFLNLPQGDNTTATARNTKGLLAWVEDLSGEEHTSHDARARVEWTVKRIPELRFVSTDASAPPQVSYKTVFAYDSLDRNTRLVYPDNDEISFLYDDRTLLRAIVGGVSGLTQDGYVTPDIQYAPSGQVERIDYGNGIHTTRAYDPRLRLKSLLTVSPHAPPTQELIHFAYELDGVSNLKRIEDRRPAAAVPEGDPGRNTQLFQYDDLHRLTRVQYSLAQPGAALRNDGEINYRYDRIGNMLAQTSTLDHQEKGLPVADLGEMDSGGPAGRWNRTGRAADDPPGPHALTAIRHSPLATRHYAYDANGNMLNIDGLVCAWDFKDRLVGVENSEMRAAYTYDYTDRRITKRVTWKPGYPLPSGTTNSLSASGGEGRGEVATVSYINKYFEVREHDAPTKYVWNGNTRVAHVNGSLSANLRVQRLRVWRGWNLVSLAVTATNALAQLSALHSPVLESAFRWNPIARAWESVSSNDTLPAGAVLWLHASANAALTVTGAYAEPASRLAPADGEFLPGAGFEAWRLSSTASNQSPTALWRFDAQNAHWLGTLPAPLDNPFEPPVCLAPGEAAFARSDTPTRLAAPDASQRIQYYLEDHLGSTVCLIDAGGTQQFESAYYPFGYPRCMVSGPDTERYRFGQKEQDGESDLSCFEARFASTILGRFLSTDPVLKDSGNPQGLHPYAYAQNNGLRFTDPSGRYKTEIDEVNDQVNIVPEGSDVKGKEDWASKIAEQLFGDRTAYTRLVPTAEAIDEQKRRGEWKGTFDYNRIYAGVPTFIDAEATRKLKESRVAETPLEPTSPSATAESKAVGIAPDPLHLREPKLTDYPFIGPDISELTLPQKVVYGLQEFGPTIFQNVGPVVLLEVLKHKGYEMSERPGTTQLPGTFILWLPPITF